MSLGGNERIELAGEAHELENEAADEPANIAREEALFEVREERADEEAIRGEKMTMWNALKRLVRGRSDRQ